MNADIPTDETVGTLEVVHTFNGAMPTGVPTKPGGPKLVCVDLSTDTVVRTIVPPPHVALETTYLNDVRSHAQALAARRGWRSSPTRRTRDRTGSSSSTSPRASRGGACTTTPRPRRRTRRTSCPSPRAGPFLERPPDGPPKPVCMGSDGIAITAGRISITSGEHNAILRRLPDGQYETFVHDPRLLWPDTMSVAADGHLYVTANQLYRQERSWGGEDRRRKPYTLFRTPIDAGPVLLR